MATRVGPYIIEKETLGQGTFGKVKLAKHADTGKDYAIKIMDKGDIKTNELMGNVKREIAIMKALNHKNIVNLREVLSSKSKLYIVMDLVRGGELFEMIEKQGELNENIARKYFQQLVDGVEYCHRRGIYHRDLKPENLLVNEDGTLKITDFGVSSMKPSTSDDSDSLLFTSCGTPYYAAPELLSKARQGYSGVKVDVWSSGVILYLLLTGTLPFQHEDMNQLYEMIQSMSPEYPPEIPADAKDLLQSMLQKDAEKRPTLTEVKEHPWFLVNYEPNVGGGSERKGAELYHRRKMEAISKSTDSRQALNQEIIKAGSEKEKFLVKSGSRSIEAFPSSGSRSGLTSEGSLSQSFKSLGITKPTDVVSKFEGQSLKDFVQAVLPGKKEKKIDEVVAKLEEIDIDCVSDIQVVADTMGNPDKFRQWLEEQSGMPSVTSMHFAKVFFP